MKRLEVSVGTAAIAGLVVLGLVAGCSADEPTATPTPAPEAEQTVEPTASPDEAEVAAILEVHDAYRAAVVSSENSGEPDPSGFYGIASEGVIEERVERVVEYARMGMHRSGEPELGEPVVDLDGDTASVEVCINEKDWAAVSQDGSTTFPSDEWKSIGIELSVIDGSWIVTDSVPTADTTITC